jgi:predicted dehydrogenase
MFRRALALVQGGAIGPIVRAQGLFEAPIRTEPGELRWRADLGGGGTMDLGCYVLHALRTLLGEEPQVRGAAAEIVDGVDAAMTSELVFPGGATAQVRSAMYGPRRDWIELHGEGGSLRLEAFVSPQRGGLLTLKTASGVVEEPAEGPASYDAQLDHLVEVMAGRTAPLTGGADAVATMTLIDAVRTAAGLDIGLAGAGAAPLTSGHSEAP